MFCSSLADVITFVSPKKRGHVGDMDTL